ncbi:MAG: hypothetical protein JNJ56_08060 [Ignavibacteria bacterium]|nr:hypothetical protein [Ignavibacteria bacterium]
MKNLKLLVTILFLFLISTPAFPQGMTLPDPIKAPMLEAMSGTWVSDTYEMMGMKFNDEVTQKMILNGQFMEIDIMSKGDNGFNYEGKGIMVPGTDGSFTGWVFDVFGKNGITTYTGKLEEGKLTMKGLSEMMTEHREIMVDGDNMTQNVSFLMKDASGKEMPEMKMTIKYKKKM